MKDKSPCNRGLERVPLTSISPDKDPPNSLTALLTIEERKFNSNSLAVTLKSRGFSSSDGEYVPEKENGLFSLFVSSPDNSITF